MTLPTSGTMTTAQVSQELYGNTTTVVDLTGSAIRGLIGKSTGTVVFPTDFYGKSNTPAPTYIAVTEGGSSVDVYAQGYSNGSSGLGSFGGITPNAAAIAGQLTSTGNGKILELIHRGDRAQTLPSTITLRIQGTYSSSTVPFTRMKVSAPEYTSNFLDLYKSNATISTSGSTTILRWPSPGWPGVTRLDFY